MITIDGVEYTEDCFEPTGTSAKTRSHIKKTLRDRLKDTYGSTKYKEFLKIQGFDDARFDYVGSVMNMMYADLTTDGIDNNANKDSKSVSRVEAEVDNANHKIAGHDALYRMMKKLYGKDEAVRLSSEMYDYTLGLNDATKILRVYCWALSGIPLVLEGRKGNPVCAPAKHLHSYVSMLAGTIHELSNSHLAGACLHASQNLILNDNGVNKSIKIKDFVERYSLDKTFTDGSDTWEFCDISNDNVYIIEDGKYVKVNKVMRRPYKDLIYTITTHTGKKVKCSKDHKFKTYVDTYEAITKASSLEVFDTVFNTNVNTPISIDKNSYDYKRGQVIGILCGDGNITRENIVRISVNGEQDYIYDAFNSFVLEHYGKGLSHEPDGRSDIYDCRVMCKEMYQDLTKDIIGLYAKDKHIDIKDKSLDYLAGFLDGVYVTDGCFNHSCAFGSISEHLVKNVSDIASLLLMKVSDVRITIDELGIRNDFYNITVTSKLLKYLDLFVKKANQSKYFNSYCIHETADICYFGKKAIKCNRKESVGGFPFYTYERYNKKYKRNTDVIVSIETEQNDEDYVYEIETESHWYSVGGILTHNCAVGSFFFDVARVMIMDGYSLEDIKDGAGRKYMTQMFQQFVFDVNDKTRIGSESPFTNISFFDRPKMRAMIEDLEWYFEPTGKDLDYIQEYVMECQRIMMDFMDIGDPITKLPFTFPVQTSCIAKDKDGNILDMEFVSDLVKRPVHHYNILVSEGTKIASCCRLLSDGDMMNNAGSVNSFGGGGSISMGSHRVVCINLNRCAIMSESEEDFTKRLDTLVFDCAKILKAHKELLYKLTEVGLQPKIADGTIDLSRCFSTVGTLGLWEMLQTLEKKFGVDEDRDVRVMKHFNDTCLKAGKQYGLNVNIEAIPGEAMAERFCKSDKLLFGDKIVPYEIYSNQTVPLTEKVDVYDRMDKDGRINLLLTGGGIVHLTIGERITPEQALNLIKYAVKSCCEHFALNLVHSMCEDGHVSEGKYTTCPVCGKPVVDYALRIVGFLRPVSSWSKARKNEFYERYIIQNNTIKAE